MVFCECHSVTTSVPSSLTFPLLVFRVVGSLLSAHLIIRDPRQPFGHVIPEGYDNELLSLANDLASRLLPAFENTATGIPYPRVSQAFENTATGIPYPRVSQDSSLQQTNDMTC